MVDSKSSVISSDNIIGGITFKEKGNRFVLFLDIMGFKERIARRGQDVILKELTELQRFLSEKMPEDSSIAYAMFSDSIIVMTNDDNLASFIKLSEIAKGILNKSIGELQMPIKGAIAHGELTVNQQKQLYFGQPLIDAYLLEEELKCYAIVLHYTVDAIIDAESTKLYRMAEVKLEKVYSSHSCLIFDSGMKEPLLNLRKQVSGTPRAYIDNTLPLMD